MLSLFPILSLLAMCNFVEMKSSRLTALLLAATAGAWGERRPSLLVLCFCFCFYPVKEKKNNPRVFKQKYKNIFLTLLLKYPWMGDKMYIIKDVHYKFPSPLGCRCPALSRTRYQRVVFVFLLQRRKKVTTDSILMIDPKCPIPNCHVFKKKFI